MKRGRFITLEGGEGVGKSTNAKFLRGYLASRSKQAILTREPGGTPFAEDIRSLLLGHREEPVSENAELLLIFAARAQHLEKLILPALEQGIWVVSDRFTDASYAYQGGGRGIDSGRIAALETWLQRGFKPDMTLLLDAPLEIALARANGRGKPDRFESEDLDFFRRVRSAYLELAEREPQRIKIIDAGEGLKEIQSQIAAHLERLLCEDG